MEHLNCPYCEGELFGDLVTKESLGHGKSKGRGGLDGYQQCLGCEGWAMYIHDSDPSTPHPDARLKALGNPTKIPGG